VANGEAAIVGIGDTAVGVVPGVSSARMHAEAITAAVRDAGISMADVDGLITCNSMIDKWPRHAMTLAENLGILQQLHFAQSVALGGASGTAGIALASQLVASGSCRNVVVVGGDPQLSGLSRDRAVEQMASFRHVEFEAPYGPLNPSCFGLLAQRHMHEFGTSSAELAQVAVTQRQHAILNGRAHMRDPITVEDVLTSRVISSPLHMLDCSLISDGAAAVVVSARARADDRAVSVVGHGEGYARQDHISMVRTLDPADLGAREASGRAFEMAGVGPDEIDVAMLYDCFTITPILLLESLGFCKVGAGGRYVVDEGIGLDSPMPVNTHGGLLSYAHAGYPSIMFGVVEAVRQLRGECDTRQVEGASVALVHGLGGMFSVHSTLILRGES
jgi:acetyl-CoA acetyltransferase